MHSLGICCGWGVLRTETEKWVGVGLEERLGSGVGKKGSSPPKAGVPELQGLQSRGCPCTLRTMRGVLIGSWVLAVSVLQCQI